MEAAGPSSPARTQGDLAAPVSGPKQQEELGMEHLTHLGQGSEGDLLQGHNYMHWVGTPGFPEGAKLERLEDVLSYDYEAFPTPPLSEQQQQPQQTEPHGAAAPPSWGSSGPDSLAVMSNLDDPDSLALLSDVGTTARAKDTRPGSGSSLSHQQLQHHSSAATWWVPQNPVAASEDAAAAAAGMQPQQSPLPPRLLPDIGSMPSVLRGSRFRQPMGRGTVQQLGVQEQVDWQAALLAPADAVAAGGSSGFGSGGRSDRGQAGSASFGSKSAQDAARVSAGAGGGGGSGSSVPARSADLLRSGSGGFGAEFSLGLGMGGTAGTGLADGDSSIWPRSPGGQSLTSFFGNGIPGFDFNTDEGLDAAAAAAPAPAAPAATKEGGMTSSCINLAAPSAARSMKRVHSGTAVINNSGIAAAATAEHLPLAALPGLSVQTAQPDGCQPGGSTSSMQPAVQDLKRQRMTSPNASDAAAGAVGSVAAAAVAGGDGGDAAAAAAGGTSSASMSRQPGWHRQPAHWVAGVRKRFPVPAASGAGSGQQQPPVSLKGSIDALIMQGKVECDSSAGKPLYGDEIQLTQTYRLPAGVAMRQSNPAAYEKVKAAAQLMTAEVLEKQVISCMPMAHDPGLLLFRVCVKGRAAEKEAMKHELRVLAAGLLLWQMKGSGGAQEPDWEAAGLAGVQPVAPAAGTTFSTNSSVMGLVLAEKLGLRR